MGDSTVRVTCPKCGSAYDVTVGTGKFFCSRCGTQIPMPNVLEYIQSKTQEAADRALDQMQVANNLAQSGAPQADVDAAFAAARQAMDAVRAAQEAQKALAAAQAQAADAQAQYQATLASMAEQERLAREAGERRRQEELARQKAAEEQARREAAARAAQTVTAQTQVVSAPARVQQPQPLEYRRGAVVRSSSGGQGLFVVTLPTTWRLDDAVLLQGNSGSRPYSAFARFSDGGSAGMTLTLGDAGTRNSAGMEAMMAQYGSAIAGVDRTNYAPLPSVRQVADDYAMQSVRAFGGSNFGCVLELGGFDLARRQQEAQALFAKAAGGSPLRDPYAAEMVRIYTFNAGGTAYKMAAYVRIYAIKDASGVDVMGMMNPVGLVLGLGNAIGNKVSRKKEAKKAKKDPNARPNADTIAESDGRPLCIPDYSDYIEEGTIYWTVDGISTVFAPADRFDRVYKEAFVPLVTGYSVHDDVKNLTAQAARQDAAAVQAATNVQIQQMNMQFRAMQEANRQVQAAADARFEAWQRQSDAHHAAFRERTNAQFNNSGGSGGAGDWSEAIRGVNTFVTSDGREVQLDVSADRAYENQAGDVIGGSGGFDPGANWTEIPRK